MIYLVVSDAQIKYYAMDTEKVVVVVIILVQINTSGYQTDNSSKYCISVEGMYPIEQN